MQKIKVFISYYHLEDQGFKETLSNHLAYDNELEDASVSLGDISDELTDEQIRQKIRDEYIKDSDVFVLLCGKNTRHRKHIDWEIHAAMYKSEVKKPLPILVINLPSSTSPYRANDEEEKMRVNNYLNSENGWFSCESRSDLEFYYPNMPERIIDSFETKNSKISVISTEMGMENIKWFIKNSYKRRNLYEYNDSRILRRKNGICE